MYNELSNAQQPFTSNCPLTLCRIWHVSADSTYQVCNFAREKGMQYFIYTTNGKGELFRNNVEYILEKGSAVLFTQEEPFYYWTLGEEWDFWWFEFLGDTPCEHDVVYFPKEDALFTHLCERAFSILPSKSAGAASCLSCLLALTAESTPNESDPHQDLFTQAQQLIRDHLYRINVSSLSGKLNMDPRTLYNLFQRYAGCSPKSYMQNYVMNQARYLLANTTKSIGEIADEIGFSNSFHFSKVFKETFGLSPSAYRHQIEWKNGLIIKR